MSIHILQILKLIWAFCKKLHIFLHQYLFSEISSSKEAAERKLAEGELKKVDPAKVSVREKAVQGKMVIKLTPFWLLCPLKLLILWDYL